MATISPFVYNGRVSCVCAEAVIPGGHRIAHPFTPMPGRSTLYRILGVCAMAASRILFRSHLLYHVDSVNFAPALRRFDPTAHQPHPPGYFLYVCLDRLVNLLLPDANAALMAISIAASCGAAWMTHLLMEEWFGGRPALIALVLFLVSPHCLFHGIDGKAILFQKDDVNARALP
jgi:hypothetical protein